MVGTELGRNRVAFRQSTISHMHQVEIRLMQDFTMSYKMLMYVLVSTMQSDTNSEYHRRCASPLFPGNPHSTPASVAQQHALLHVHLSQHLSQLPR